MGVYKGALGLGVVVILVVVLLRLSGRIHGDGVGTVLAAAGDVISSEDPEPIDPGAVLDSVGLAVVPDVAVLPPPLVVAHTLLPVDHAVLLGEGGPELARPGVESLLLQNSGQARVRLRRALTTGSQNGNN